MPVNDQKIPAKYQKRPKFLSYEIPEDLMTPPNVRTDV